ncbi:CHAT domain-containing protein [Cryptosporangium phraense]|uniref:CHAT domain-containing protein n=1 Tax=Cryptosporangium phraense TaxID=2593070 RepID=A0A545AZT2_9ACTN|nr:CHAT domain-containing protein [Cryptosporangium phraense]TQS46841.1 CHAT domain-containing protein [Cryptosporangium phraense]
MDPSDDAIAEHRRDAAGGSINAMNDLAMALRDRYRYRGDAADLLDAIATLRTAIAHVPDHPIRHSLRANLSALLLDRFEEFGELDDLYRVLAGCDESIPRLDPDGRLVAETMRAETLVVLAEHTGQAGFAVEALAAAAALPDDPPVRFVRAKAQLVRYRFTADRGALSEAVELLAADARTATGDRVPLVLGLLGDALLDVADDTGDETVRQTAIGHLRTTLDDTPSGSPLRLQRQINLAAALRDRGRHTGDATAGREGVDLMRDVVAGTDPESRFWPNRLDNYLTALDDLVDLTGDLAVLDEALRIAGRAGGGRAGASRAGASRAGVTTMLLTGLLYRQRFVHTRDERDLAAAIAAFVDAVDQDPDQVAAQGNLAAARLSEYELTGDPEALRQAVTGSAAVVRGSPPGSSTRGEALVIHANALLASAERRSDPGMLAAVRHTLREAARIPALRPAKRVEAARDWARIEARTDAWSAATDAYTYAVELLPLVAPRRLARVDQQRALARLDGLAAEAAACALQAGDPPTAVRLLELGRGVLGGQGLQRRSDLSQLRSRAPGLADELSAAFDRLVPSAPVTGLDADDRHAQDLRLAELLDRARRLDGLADFLAPPNLTRLLAATADGPVVLVNVSAVRSDALIVKPSGVTPVGLPGLTPGAVTDRAAAFGAALAAAAVPGPGERAAQDTVADVLRWLWDEIAEPVLARLGHTAPGPAAGPAGGVAGGVAWPRVWWSPVGELAMLPLHAAAPGPDGAGVLDRVISSYTPTLRALGEASGPVAVDEGDLVTVAVGDAPGAPVLANVEREATAIGAPFRLDGEQASVAAVRAALTTHPSVHFACHGASDVDDPSASHLLLSDGRLTALDVSALDLSDARLAVLSACETALGTRRIPDESLHLVSAFQLAGYRAVIGTLWPVNDLVARRVAVDLHAGLRAGSDPATALHHAVRRCRARYPATPTLWAAHVHSGR